MNFTVAIIISLVKTIFLFKTCKIKLKVFFKLKFEYHNSLLISFNIFINKAENDDKSIEI